MQSFFYYLWLLILRLFSWDFFSNPTTIPAITSTTTRFPNPPPNFNCSYVPNKTPANSGCSYGFTGSYCDECGLTFKNRNVKIVGGQDAIPNSWPSIALIIFKYKVNYSVEGKSYQDEVNYLCGGTLIDRKTVVTASHCYKKEIEVERNGEIIQLEVKPNEYYPTFESMYTVYLGLHDNSGIFNGLGLESAITMPVKQYINHPEYDDETILNDIAIIKLDGEVQLDCNIQTACLPNPANIGYPTKYTNVSVWAAGWGALASGGNTPDVLQNVKMSLYDGSVCQNVANTVKDWTKQICAGELAGGKDTCQGDSGGPLFVQDTVNGKQKHILIGVVSYGVGCGSPNSPGVFARVSGYLPWIKQHSN